MKDRAVYKLFLFLTGLVLIYAIFEFANYKLIVSNDNFKQSVNNFDSQNIGGLILGDSHPAFDVDPDLLSKDWYNFAYPGENLIATYLKLKYALSKNLRIKYVILPLDFHIFTAYRREGVDYSNYYSITPMKEVNKIIGTQESLKSVLKYYLPLSSYFNRQQFVEYSFSRIAHLSMRNRTNVKKISISRSGHFISAENSYSELSSIGRTRFVQERIKEQFRYPIVDRLLAEYFLKILELCKEHGIKIIGVWFPVSMEYLSLLPEQEVNKVVQEIDRHRSQFLAIQDYTRLYEQNPEYFSDPDHLNEEGSCAFTKVLRSDLSEAGVMFGGKDAYHPV